MSITEINEGGEIQIYPNPSQDIVNIKLVDVNSKNIDFNFFDIMGRKVNVEKVNVSDNIYQFNFSNKPKGIYFININVNGIKYTSKISIIR